MSTFGVKGRKEMMVMIARRVQRFMAMVDQDENLT